MKILRNFLVGVVIGILTVIFAGAILQSVLGSSNVTIVSGAGMNTANVIWVVVIYGIGTAILSWIAWKIKRMFSSPNKK